jgi:predicted nucleic acid-binding Zn ribbon protein
MPIYEYVCPDCGSRREVFMRTVPEVVAKLLATECVGCHGPMKLSVGRGVITRYGADYLTKKMLEAGQVKDPHGKGVDLGIYGN